MPYYIEALNTYSKKILKEYKVKEHFDDADEAWRCVDFLSTRHRSANFTVYREEVNKGVEKARSR